MSEEHDQKNQPKLNLGASDPIGARFDQLEKMFAQFLIKSQEDCSKASEDIDQIRSIIQPGQKTYSPSVSVGSFQDNSIQDRRAETRRSSIVLRLFKILSKPKDNRFRFFKQMLFMREKKVSSLEGLRYLDKQYQILSSKYPGRLIQLAQMVSFNLRESVIGSYNTFLCEESQFTGHPVHEILSQNWLQLSNTKVSDILLEAARPRTIEKYSIELVHFLGKNIPQSPSVNAENFSKFFYCHLMDSLMSMVHLYSTLSQETSSLNTNESKMPAAGMGTKESPGRIALWLISLGIQKDRILQFLGSDALHKHKAVDQAAKYFRQRFMAARSQSESRQDLDSKFTPVNYESIRQTQGESFTRHQVPNLQPLHDKSRYQHRINPSQYHNSTFAAIDTSDDDFSTTPYKDSQDPNFDDQHTFELSDESNYPYFDSSDNFEYLNPQLNALQESSYSSISAVLRGYCSSHFVFGECSKRLTGCSFDHSASGLERCIQSFTLLSKRELDRHARLPPWTTPTLDPKQMTPACTFPDRKYGLSPTQRPSNLSKPYPK